MNKGEVIEQAKVGDRYEYWRQVMRSLSRLERKVLTIVADCQPLVVKEIAKRGFTSEQTASGTLRQLRKYNLVISEKRGDKRESHYSLIDAPLAEMLRLRHRVGAQNVQEPFHEAGECNEVVIYDDLW